MSLMNWISSNISALTLFVTGVLTIITLFYTLITRQMLRLAAQPTVAIKALNVSIYPEIPDTAKVAGSDDDLEKERYCLAFELDLANIGSQPAQNVYVDAEVNFKVNKPLGYKALPVHLPEFVSFIPPQSNDNDKTVSVAVRFDNFVAREIIRDFFAGRQDRIGSPFLPLRTEMENTKLWPSPKVTIRCLYADIQGNNYLSQLQLFFHIWKDSEHNKLDIYLLNMLELEFIAIKPVSKWFREYYIKHNRHKRYTSFSGEKYSKKVLKLLVAK